MSCFAALLVLITVITISHPLSNQGGYNTEPILESGLYNVRSGANEDARYRQLLQLLAQLQTQTVERYPIQVAAGDQQGVRTMYQQQTLPQKSTVFQHQPIQQPQTSRVVQQTQNKGLVQMLLEGLQQPLEQLRVLLNQVVDGTLKQVPSTGREIVQSQYVVQQSPQIESVVPIQSSMPMQAEEVQLTSAPKAAVSQLTSYEGINQELVQPVSVLLKLIGQLREAEPVSPFVQAISTTTKLKNNPLSNQDQSEISGINKYEKAVSEKEGQVPAITQFAQQKLSPQEIQALIAQLQQMAAKN